MEPIILASASARRQQLLTQIGVHFIVRGQDIDETIRDAELPHDYVVRMAMEKANSALDEITVNQENAHSIVLAADTSVVCDADVLGKPGNEADALSMLQRLSNREHRVLSAVTLASQYKQRTILCESRVNFRKITLDEARQYYRSGEPQGKAGAYAIQGFAAVFVRRLTGSYSGVMGLPLFETAQLLAEFGVPVTL
ncbi:MAG: Maf family protein [Pseudohongiellaceae bacterium]